MLARKKIGSHSCVKGQVWPRRKQGASAPKPLLCCRSAHNRAQSQDISQLAVGTLGLFHCMPAKNHFMNHKEKDHPSSLLSSSSRKTIHYSSLSSSASPICHVQSHPSEHCLLFPGATDCGISDLPWQLSSGIGKTRTCKWHYKPSMQKG